MRRWSAFFIVLMLLSGSAGGQTPSDATNSEDGEAQTPAESVDQSLALNTKIDDRAIASRLNRVYTASGWFDELEVAVDDGVVILDGIAQDEQARQWAGRVASETQGVTVVINRVEVSVPPSIDSYSIRAEIASLWRGFYRLLPLIGIGLLALLFSVLIARFMSGVLTRPIARLTESKLLQNIARKIIGLVIILAGLILFLRLTGLTSVAVTVLSGTGILGLIIGFAFRDIAENFLASVLLSVQTPFHIGDVIEVAGHTGVVHKVTSRGTVLVDFDGNHIQIANATVYKSTLVNYSANPKRRLTFDVGIGFDASITVAQDIVLNVLQHHPAVLDDPEPLVLVNQLGAATINLKIYYWINASKHSVMKVPSAVMRSSLRALEDAGISLPDEAREIIFPQDVPVVLKHQNEDTQSPEPMPDDRPQTPSLGSHNKHADPDPIATESEGDLTSEVEQIKTQAAESRELEGDAESDNA